MKEYIERESLQKTMEFVTNDCTCPLHIAAKIDQYIAQEPVADVAPVRHGEWLPDPNISGIYICSCCQNESYLCQPNYEEIVTWQFCPNCGAYMAGGDK